MAATFCLLNKTQNPAWLPGNSPLGNSSYSSVFPNLEADFLATLGFVVPRGPPSLQPSHLPTPRAMLVALLGPAASGCATPWVRVIPEAGGSVFPVSCRAGVIVCLLLCALKAAARCYCHPGQRGSPQHASTGPFLTGNHLAVSDQLDSVLAFG